MEGGGHWQTGERAGTFQLHPDVLCDVGLPALGPDCCPHTMREGQMSSCPGCLGAELPYCPMQGVWVVSASFPCPHPLVRSVTEGKCAVSQGGRTVMRPRIPRPLGRLVTGLALLPLEIPVQLCHPGKESPLQERPKNHTDQEESSHLPGGHPGTAADHLGMRSAGRGNSPFLSLCFFPPEVQTLPWAAPLISREDFLTVDCLVWAPSACSLFLPLPPSCPGWSQENSPACPSAASRESASLLAPQCIGRACVVWRTWRWGFNSCILYPALSLGLTSEHL